MCLLMTICAALVFTAVLANKKKNGTATKSLFTATLMFWAASLMWSVDGIASVIGGEGFFDLSAEDAILGAIILACGCAAFALLTVIEKRRAVAKA